MQIDNANDILSGMTILMVFFSSFYCEHGGYKLFIPSAFGSLWHELDNSKFLIGEITHLLIVISCIIWVSAMRSSVESYYFTFQTEANTKKREMFNLQPYIK